MGSPATEPGRIEVNELPHPKTIGRTFALATKELTVEAFAAPTRTTLREAAGAWLAAAEQGLVRTRSGERYKPSALRSYRAALNGRVLPRLGALRLSAVTRHQIQELVDHLVAEGLSATLSAIRSCRCGRSFAAPVHARSWRRTRRLA